MKVWRAVEHCASCPPDGQLRAGHYGEWAALATYEADANRRCRELLETADGKAG
jgi:hypothetical protein